MQRIERRFAWPLSLILFASGWSCNTLTGAGDLSICSGAECDPQTSTKADSSTTGSSGSGSASSSSGTSASSASSSGASSSASSSSSSSSGEPVGCEKPETDLLAYFPLDETSGTVVKDCSGRGNHGSVIGAEPTGDVWAAGKFGRGFATGNTACIDLGKPVDLLREGAAFTVSAWANASTFGSTTSFYLLGRSRDPENAGWRVGADMGNAWGTKFNDLTKGPVVLSSPTGQPSGVWTHVTVTYAPNNSATVYLDGVPSGTTGLSTITVDDVATVRIGCRGDGLLHFRGTVDEVRFYSRAFSAAEVAALAARIP